MATPVVQSSNTATAASNSVTVTKPTGLAVGDLLVAILGVIANSGITINTPSGWTSGEKADGGTSNAAFFWKIADSADVAASNFTFTASAVSGNGMDVYLARVTGHSATSPISDSQLTSNTTTFSVTPLVSDALMFLAGIQKTAAGGGWAGYTISGSNPTWTEVYDAAHQLYMGIATATGNSSATITSADVLEGGANDEWRLLICIAATTNGATTLDVIPIAATVNDLSPRVDMAVTLDVVPITITTPTQSFATPTSTWTNASKNAATNITNTDKS